MILFFYLHHPLINQNRSQADTALNAPTVYYAGTLCEILRFMNRLSFFLVVLILHLNVVFGQTPSGNNAPP